MEKGQQRISAHALPICHLSSFVSPSQFTNLLVREKHVHRTVIYLLKLFSIFIYFFYFIHCVPSMYLIYLSILVFKQKILNFPYRAVFFNFSFYKMFFIYHFTLFLGHFLFHLWERIKIKNKLRRLKDKMKK